MDVWRYTTVNILTPGHMAVFALVVVLLFGFKRLPDAARSIGKSMRIFKSEIREMQSEGKTDASAVESRNPAPAPVQSERVDPAPAPEQDHTEARPA